MPGDAHRRWVALREWWVFDAFLQLSTLPAVLVLGALVVIRCHLFGSRQPVNPWITEPVDNLEVVTAPDGGPLRCSTCSGSGFRPMPWRNVPGLRHLRMYYPPTRRNAAGFGYCPDCRYGLRVKRVPG